MLRFRNDNVMFNIKKSFDKNIKREYNKNVKYRKSLFLYYLGGNFMKKSSLLKTIVVIGLSLLLIVNVVSVVSAADEDTFGWEVPTTTNTTNTTTDTSSNTVDSVSSNTVDTTNSITTNTSTTTDISNTSISTENVTTTFNTSTNIEDNETNEVNSLAYTGIENNSVLVVVILVGAIVAGYSLKKVKEYNI